MTARSRGAAAMPLGRPVAYLTKRFPRLSETFILDEILGLEASGVPLLLVAIADPHEAVVQPDVARVRSAITYLHPQGGLADRVAWLAGTVACHARIAARHPLRYAAALTAMARDGHGWPSLSHFLDAGRLAVLLEQRGVAHLHAAFAHSPAAIAHHVHRLTGLPFSFGAHAKDLYLSDPGSLAARVAAVEFATACSQSAASMLRSIAGPAADRVVLNYHGVDVERFRADPGEAAGRPYTLLAVGRLVEKKGYPVLLQALALLAAEGTPVACRIVGAGPLQAQLERQARDLGLTGSVAFVGARNHQEIAQAYRTASAFVQASVVLADGDRDGIPNALLEAMASGLPVVATRVAGIPEAVVDGATGFLVAPGDPGALAERIGWLMSDPALGARLGLAGRARVLQRFDRSAAIRELARRFPGLEPDAPGEERRAAEQAVRTIAAPALNTLGGTPPAEASGGAR